MGDKLKQLLERCYRQIERTYEYLEIMEESSYNVIPSDDDEAYDEIQSTLIIAKRELEEFETTNGYDVEELLK